MLKQLNLIHIYNVFGVGAVCLSLLGACKNKTQTTPQPQNAAVETQIQVESQLQVESPYEAQPKSENRGKSHLETQTRNTDKARGDEIARDSMKRDSVQQKATGRAADTNGVTQSTVPASSVKTMDSKDIQMAARKLADQKVPDIDINLKTPTLQQPQKNQAAAGTENAPGKSTTRTKSTSLVPKTRKEKEQECFKAALLDTPVQHYCKCDINDLGNRECVYSGDY